MAHQKQHLASDLPFLPLAWSLSGPAYCAEL